VRGGGENLKDAKQLSSSKTNPASVSLNSDKGNWAR